MYMSPCWEVFCKCAFMWTRRVCVCVCVCVCVTAEHDLSHKSDWAGLKPTIMFTHDVKISKSLQQDHKLCPIFPVAFLFFVKVRCLLYGRLWLRGRASVLLSSGLIPLVCMSKCSWARYWIPNCSWYAGRHLAWQPPPLVYECIYEFRKFTTHNAPRLLAITGLQSPHHQIFLSLPSQNSQHWLLCTPTHVQAHLNIACMCLSFTIYHINTHNSDRRKTTPSLSLPFLPSRSEKTHTHLHTLATYPLTWSPLAGTKHSPQVFMGQTQSGKGGEAVNNSGCGWRAGHLPTGGVKQGRCCQSVTKHKSLITFWPTHMLENSVLC